jgi:hypothetical protein
LAKDLRELPLGSSPSSPAEATVQTTADELMKAIADRADYLLSKSFPEEPPFPTGPRDYVALWEAEQDRREEQRRAKKLAGKISREPEREAIRREATPLPRPPPTRV